MSINIFVFTNSHFKILILGEMGELDSADARDYVFYRPLITKDVEKLETRRAHMNTI